ncbi:ribonuclease domain-containing protein [Streptomyces sp. HNM0645]|uniref:ribonuclease domain-containing protein n=1 Tax=Streptomyces sp. HNM0645 TaxID=2782343 RepID=UPI0024B7D2CD|nr:ribonuclease domain-containing protein [Streptomyces sp. HNM0645]MDI9885741.1 ribonuclease domain-containing protein [Streptomyces sp. HNM0645]
MPNRPPRFLLVLLSALIALLPTGCSDAGAGSGTGTAANSPAVPAPAGLSTVRVADLPPEARETLRLIDDRGPFPYRKDGSTFGNFEGILPERERGHYREYTVPTPGERDRGARRIVTCREGEVYYTDDHYETFRVVLR